jgi:hypothetical protein
VKSVNLYKAIVASSSKNLVIMTVMSLRLYDKKLEPKMMIRTKKTGGPRVDDCCKRQNFNRHFMVIATVVIGESNIFCLFNYWLLAISCVRILGRSCIVER